MRAVRVVVLEVLGNDDLEVTTPEDQHTVETLTAQGADHPFADGIGTRCPDRGLHDSNAVCSEDVVEGPRELGVTVPDQELDGHRPLRQLSADVARLLGHPRGGRVGGDPSQVDEPGVQFDEDQHVEAPEQHGVD